MKNLWITAGLAAACVASLAKIPPPVLDDAAKAKAAETAAKTAWQSKIDAFQLCRVQDKVATHYRSRAGTGAGKDAKAMPVSMTASAARPAAAASVAKGPAVVAAAAPPAAAASNVAAGPATPTGCADPGPFAYTAPTEKPLEAAGAHSPAGNASSPPSGRATSAELAPAKK